MKCSLSFLLSPWVIVGSATAGILLAVLEPDMVGYVTPFGSLYLKLLQMLALPVLMTAIISGVGGLFTSGVARDYIYKIIFFIIVNFIIASGTGAFFGLLGNIGSDLSSDAQAVLGKMIANSETHSGGIKNADSARLLSFVGAMIPSNIFASLAKGENLAVLFFSILVGISVGLLRSEAGNSAIKVVDAFYQAFLETINWLMYLLPIGLFCLFASQITEVGFDVLWAMSKLVLYVYISSIALLIVFSMVMWSKSGRSYFQTLKEFRQTFFVAFGTASGLATIPSALSVLQNKFLIDRNISDLVLPLGITINPPGSILYFSLTGIFVAQIYNSALDMGDLFVLTTGAILAGISSASAPGIAGLSMIAILLEPLNLPVEVAIILLIAIDPIIDPILTVVNVFANSVMTMLIDSKYKNQSLSIQEP